MNERLLTQDEFEAAETKGKWENDCTPIMEAQDRKTMSALIAWLDDACPHGTLAIDTSKASRRECNQCWAELKESVKHE